MAAGLAFLLATLPQDGRNRGGRVEEGGMKDGRMERVVGRE